MLPDAVLRYADHDEAVIDVHLPGGSLPVGPDSPGRRTASTAGSGRSSTTAGTPARWREHSPTRGTSWRRRSIAGCGAVAAGRSPGRTCCWLCRRLPELLGSIGVTTGRTLVVVGHSAGGHLALWLATTGVPIERVVALAPVCDLREAIRLGLGSNATQAFLDGADPDQGPTRWCAGGERPGAEVVVLHGEDDAPTYRCH